MKFVLPRGIAKKDTLRQLLSAPGAIFKVLRDSDAAIRAECRFIRSSGFVKRRIAAGIIAGAICLAAKTRVQWVAFLGVFRNVEF